ncbi:MAG: hypothetical protein M1831_003607 [Alyxoria varia]|nr:MAG: hypothetical protein M1831_003607 [Alyxoria varia]
MDTQMVDNASEGPPSQRGSRPTSPGGTWRELKNTRVVEVSGLRNVDGSQDDVQDDQEEDSDTNQPYRYRPRTFPYLRYLPYRHNDRQYENFRTCIKKLYIAVAAGDFVPGATHWTRELRGWMQLKFDMPKQERIRLTRLYYELALAPGMESNAAERFSSMFMHLTKKKHYLRVGEDLYLDWRPLYRELKTLVLPSDAASVVTFNSGHPRTSTKTLIKLCLFAQLYFDPDEIPAMLEEILPYFSMSSPDTAFTVIALINLLLPTSHAPSSSKWQAQYYLPSLFHVWSLINRSKSTDNNFLDLFSRIARDGLVCESANFTPWGIFTNEQASTTFTAVLRMLEIPVSQVTSPYSSTVDAAQGLALALHRDQRKQPIAHHIARWIIYSLSPLCDSEPDSMLSKLEGLVQAVETFFHPSNTGAWTKNLSQLIFYLADFFVMRWNRERSGEMMVPESRRLNDSIKRRFVLCLRDVTFLGIFGKSGIAINFSLSSLQSLAYLEPELILPGALQRIYPSLRGSVEVHRTTSSIRALHELARIMTRTKGFRCHVTSLLGLTLPGIDANDLDKTIHALSFMQAVFYEIPMVDLTSTKAPNPDDTEETESTIDGMLASQWVTNQIERLEMEGVDIEIDYDRELSDAEEEKIVRSSTADFRAFVSTLLESVFQLLRNLPDATRLKSGAPEENIANSLPAAFTPLFSTMSPDLYDLALNKISEFINKHVVYQARDAMAFICSVLTKVDPKKALGVLLPILTRNIRTEIDENDAGSTRATGSEVLPRDKALIYNIGILSMSVVHVGSALVDFADELLVIGQYMHKNCKGTSATHASNFIHHVLLTLTMTYTVDHALYEEADIADGLSPDHWGKSIDPSRLNIKWHYSDRKEIDFAVEIFTKFGRGTLDRLTELISESPPIKRDGSGKDWSDEMSKLLVLLRLMISGVSCLLDSRHDIGVAPETIPSIDGSGDDDSMESEDETDGPTDAEYGATEDEDVKPTFRYPTGYQLQPGDKNYTQLHSHRLEIGDVLHRIHTFLTEKQQDDVTSFNALYTTYRSWFTDVGFERSAHVLDRVTRLFVADVGPFKVSGLRKSYPRPLLVRRANVYHLQRLRHNASPRHKTEPDLILLRDLVESSVCYYTEIRRTAQTAIEAAMRVIIGARPLIIPPLLEHFREAIKTNDFPRIKGAMYSLLFGNLTKPVGRDWRFAPSIIRSYVDVMDVDKLSIQKIATSAAFQIMDMTRQISRVVVVDKDRVDEIAPTDPEQLEKTKSQISKRHEVITKRFDFTRSRKREVSEELADVAKNAHWKKESRTATLVVGLSLRFEDVSSPTLVELLVKKSIDSHPSLRAIYNSALMGLFTFVDIRAVSDHKYENFVLDKQKVPGFFKKIPDREDPEMTNNYLAQFGQADAESYVDQDHPGWLVWGATIPAFEASKSSVLEYDDVEMGVRKHIGSLLDRDWFAKYFDYMKQEPRDQAYDRFRVTNAVSLTCAFNYIFTDLAKATFEDIQQLVNEIFADGSDKHQHRATAEILAGLLNAAVPLDPSSRANVWGYVFPVVRNIFEDGITPENQTYWTTFLDVILQNKDPRRSWPLVEWLASFRLDMSSNAAFKESSKITLLEHSILDLGWHFKLGDAVFDDFVNHVDHPYKGVREVMGQTLACLSRAHYHESYKDVQTLIEQERAASDIGSRPYEPSASFGTTIRSIFAQIEKWRQERPAGQQSASPYTSGSKTVLAWLESSLLSYECTQVVRFIPEILLQSLLHMMDIKEDPELQSRAYAVFRHLGNIPYRAGEEEDFVTACVRIGRHATSWHQRLRIMINIQAVYFRHLFLMPRARQQELFDCISAMLEDSQLEVRVGAGATLSGMIRCSPLSLRNSVIEKLISHFTDMLLKNPLPPRGSRKTNNNNSNASGSASSPAPGGIEQSRVVITRHAAVLGLGALVQAFPYTSPPPKWMPAVLATLATRAAGNPGVVGKSAKGIVSDFKKTRQDTWHIDVKAFETEQLEDLEGVLWKSYFA